MTLKEKANLEMAKRWFYLRGLRYKKLDIRG